MSKIYTRSVVSCSDDQTIKIWDPISGHVIKHFDDHSNYVYSLALNIDGKILASASRDTTVRIWNYQSGECIKVLNGHTDDVGSVAFS